MSETIMPMRFKKSLATAGVALLPLTLAACSSGEKEVRPMPPLPAIEQVPTTPPVSEFKRLQEYLHSDDRLSRLKPRMRNVGQAVLNHEASNGNWGPFDTYCFENQMQKGGWESRGYVPQVGDTCVVQHNPQYGGPNNQVAAEFKVGKNRQFDSDDVQGILTDDLNGNGCSVNIETISGTIEVGINPGDARANTMHVDTVAEVQKIDEAAIECIDGAFGYKL